MIELLHLASGAAVLANSPNETRIRAIRSDRWVGFDRARRVLRHLDGLCDHPPSTRPPGLAIYGHSGMGKTMLVEKFKRDHPPIIDHSTGVESMPVLAITLTSRPTERRIYGQLLMAMGASINERLTLMELEIRTVLLLKSNNVRVLVFDEVHNLLAGTPREQRVILQLLRYLSNEIKASLVCLGVSEARDAIAGDTQLARRLDQFVLPRWKADEEFQELVTAILRSLPLKLPSALSSQSLRHLSRLGDGITARVFGILNELAIEAIQDGTERITDENIESWKPALEKEAAFA
ncbi:TniB family NTP-binding protein [Stappia sp. P2PMeth1]|uniref:TniB family NTP-binding protein n=1 Tax=Stappia sp. P2PMeth1 TaxID=2003586 RepID=UPI001FCA6372|nr:TniB family NTP-binding protein [Stappia sp. P2PMeth1]